MASLKIGIVEDELLIAANLSNTLQNIGYAVTQVASTYNEAVNMLHFEKPDLVLLDINIKGPKDGIAVAMYIKENYDIPFIFLTAFADTATLDRAKETEPNAYLIKPFSKEDLYTAIEICMHNYNKRMHNKMVNENAIIKDAIFIKNGNHFNKINFADIIYLEADHVYVNVVTTNKKIVVRSSLQLYSTHFDSTNFFKIHRSYIINLMHIDTINTETITINGKMLPLGRNYRDALLKRLKLG